MERMGNPAIDRGASFTYRHYKTWPDEERWELIDGRAWAMSPAPTLNHQDIAGMLYADMRTFLREKNCRPFIAPFDVLLPEGDEADDEVATVVQPDIVVFCDKSKLTKAGARGAPDLVVEILSPSTSKKDLGDKFRLYEKHQVREYWVVDPVGEWLCVYRLDPAGRYDQGALREKGRGRDWSPVESSVLPGFVVDPVELFADMD
jgi:Uma2 family endonuclease